jgi:RNA polymerase sigma factor (TIGR02999 family)
MAENEQSQATKMLAALCDGDGSAAERLLPLVYTQLRAMAGGLFKYQSPGQTLQPTALVHEAYLKLVDQTNPQWKSRAHFMAVAAMAMRQILTDAARARRAQKRGGDWQRVSLDSGSTSRSGGEVDVVSLDDALERLSQLNDRHSRIVQLRFFGGLTMQEAADVLGISRATADNDWRIARAWLSAQLSEGA